MDDRESLIAAYEAGPDELRNAMAGMSAEEIRARPIAGKWSTHEIVCHLADFEIINADRIKRVLAEDRPTLFNAEPDTFAASLAYEARDTERELQLIAALRGHVAAILRTLRPEKWERTGTHSTDGALTLTQLVQRTTRHIPHHLPFIAEKREALRKARI